MIRRTDDLRIRDIRPLIPPAILIEELPITARAASTVAATRAAVAAVLRGDDPRLVAVVGPCSIHDTGAAAEYAERLHDVARRLADDLVVVMRGYFEKPRTVAGWKGLINDPDLDGSYHINKGLRLARTLLLAINGRGLPTASEFLDTQMPQYLADLTSVAAIGARTTESQVHRELASGLSMPVGFKNGTNGNVQIAVDAVASARQPHWFAGVTKQGIGAILQTAGNDTCFVILRGGTRTGPNHHARSVDETVAQAGGGGPSRARDGGLFARQQRQGPPQADRGGRRRRRPGRGGVVAHLRRDDREPPRGGAAGRAAGRRAGAGVRASRTPASRSTRRCRCSNASRNPAPQAPARRVEGLPHDDA